MLLKGVCTFKNSGASKIKFSNDIEIPMKKSKVLIARLSFLT